MLRITETKNSNNKVTLELEGKITSNWVTELISQCHKSFIDETMVILDLGKVSYIDEQGVYALKALHKEKVKLTNCSLFLSALLTDLLENQQDSCDANICS